MIKELNQIKIRVIKEFLDLIVLIRLKSVPSSGYDIFRYILEDYKVFISTGIIYSVMYSLERKGLVKGISTNRKRLYSLTSKGEDVIKNYLDNYDEIVRLITSLLKIEKASM